MTGCVECGCRIRNRKHLGRPRKLCHRAACRRARCNRLRREYRRKA